MKKGSHFVNSFKREAAEYAMQFGIKATLEHYKEQGTPFAQNSLSRWVKQHKLGKFSKNRDHLTTIRWRKNSGGNKTATAAKVFTAPADIPQANTSSQEVAFLKAENEALKKLLKAYL